MIEFADKKDSKGFYNKIIRKKRNNSFFDIDINDNSNNGNDNELHL